MSGAKKNLQRAPVLESRGRIREVLGEWFRREGKSYPWRETTDPYAIAVSEIMLQQTQVETVIAYFRRWLERFPSWQSLAAAEEAEVLKMWEGLGYYSRARNLYRMSQVVVEAGGEFPREVEAIEKLPGLGRYTARAVATFSWDAPEPIVDANIARVLARLFDYQERVDSGPGTRQIWKWAEELLDRDQPRIYNSALMELGQQICLPQKPMCVLCPVRRWCQATDPVTLPRKKPRRATEKVDEHALYMRKGEKIYLERERGRRRQGLWKFPLVEEAPAEDYPLLLKKKYPIMHYAVQLHLYEAPESEARVREGEWFSRSEIEALAMPSPYRRVLRALWDGDSV